ncbi:alkanesulfonate monooxygenase SsuD/methylene tetrahydromethanopterin reductase-like flavin-dependent oxidoreductase (luciferase family) [Bacillus sp. RC252]
MRKRGNRKPHWCICNERGTVEEVSVKIEDMKNRRKKVTEEPLQSFGLAAYVICRDTEEEALEEWRRITDVKDDALGYAGNI